MPKESSSTGTRKWRGVFCVTSGSPKPQIRQEDPRQTTRSPFTRICFKIWRFEVTVKENSICSLICPYAISLLAHYIVTYALQIYNIFSKSGSSVASILDFPAVLAPFGQQASRRQQPSSATHRARIQGPQADLELLQSHPARNARQAFRRPRPHTSVPAAGSLAQRAQRNRKAAFIPGPYHTHKARAQSPSRIPTPVCPPTMKPPLLPSCPAESRVY